MTTSRGRLRSIALVGLLLASVVVAGIAWRRHRYPTRLLFTRLYFTNLFAPAGPVYPDPPGILIHHSDTPASLHGVVFNAATLDRIAKQRGYSIKFEGKIYHISYHYVILPDGTVQPGRPEHCAGAHCPKYNNWLGICLIGDFHQKRHWWPSKPTDRQKAALVSLCERLMSKYHIPPENVRRHRDVHQTWCPGDRFPYHEIIGELQAYAAVHPETRTGARPAAMLASAAGSPGAAPAKRAVR